MRKYVPLFETYSTPAWWVGLADCNGIESFIKEPDRKGWSNQVGMLQMRARANSQRHAVVYRVKLNPEDADQIESMLTDGEYIEALSLLKEVALETQIARGTGINAEKAWSMIPNPDLDPFS
jgi:hypothetical protein